MKSATESAARRAAATRKLPSLPRNSVDAPGEAVVSRARRRRFGKLVWSVVLGAAVSLGGQALADHAGPSSIGASVGESHDHVQAPDAKNASVQLIAVSALYHARAVKPGSEIEHHGAFTTDGGFFWVSLNSRQILVIDVSSDATPRLVKTIDIDEISSTTLTLQQIRALPGRMLIAAGQDAHGAGQSALIEYSDEGEYVATHRVPATRDNAEPLGPVESLHVSGGTLEVQWAWGDFAPSLIRKRGNSVSWRLRPDGPFTTATVRATE